MRGAVRLALEPTPVGWTGRVLFGNAIGAFVAQTVARWSLAAADERPLAERPDIANWSENYCLQAYDASRALGVYMHCGLPVYDFDLWHDLSVVYLPDGDELLYAKGFGERRDSGVDVAGSMLTAEYEESTGEWVWRFHGAATRASRRTLAVTAATDGPCEPLRFELRYIGTAPVWELGNDVEGQVWTRAHWEQSCAVLGWIEIGGRRTEFDGSGIRDHSRGPRDLTYLGSHYWLSGQFAGDDPSRCCMYRRHRVSRKRCPRASSRRTASCTTPRCSACRPATCSTAASSWRYRVRTARPA